MSLTECSCFGRTLEINSNSISQVKDGARYGLLCMNSKPVPATYTALGAKHAHMAVSSPQIFQEIRTKFITGCGVRLYSNKVIWRHRQNKIKL